MEALAITAVGVVSPLGVGFDRFRAGLAAAGPTSTLAAQPSTVLTGERFAHARVAEVRDFDAAAYLGDKGLRNFDRLTRMLIVAAKQALEGAGIKRDGAFLVASPERVGLCAATAYGALDSITEINRVAELEHPRYINPSRFPNTVINSAAGYASIWEDLQGPNVTIVDGHCGPLDAVLTASMHLTHGRADALLVGGFEVLSEPLFLAFEKLGMGLVLGEGAALCCMERLAESRARGASVLAEVAGFGAAFEPPESEAALVHASPYAVERAVRGALRDAGIAPSDIDLVCASEGGRHPAAGPEAEGLARVLGPDVATVASPEIFGEAFGAGGALGLAAGVAWLGGVPCPSQMRGRARPNLEHVLVTATGVYGNVSAVVLRKASGR